MSSILQVERLTENQLRDAVERTMVDLSELETDPVVKRGQESMIADFRAGRDGEAWTKSMVALRVFLTNLAKVAS